MCLVWFARSAPDPPDTEWMVFAGAKTGYRLPVYSSSFRVPATPTERGWSASHNGLMARAGAIPLRVARHATEWRMGVEKPT